MDVRISRSVFLLVALGLLAGASMDAHAQATPDPAAEEKQP